METLNRLVRTSRFTSGHEDESFLKLFVAKRLIQGAAVALLGVFLPIFLYETADELFVIVGSFYAALSLLYLLLLAPGMKVINRIGFTKALAFSAVCSVVLHSLLFFLTPSNFSTLLPFIIISMVAFWIFHWVPFQVDFVIFGRRENRTRQVSVSMATMGFMGVVGPVLAGFIVANAGYQTLFGVAIVLMLAAVFSYALVPETDTKFTWSVGETWRTFFSREHRPVVLAEAAFGAETVINLVVWPIFLFVILRGNLLEVGIISTIVVAVTILLQLLLGKYLDTHVAALEKTLRLGSVLNAIAWVVKIFILSAVQVFFVGLFHNLVRMFTRTPYLAILYDTSADQGKYIDEFTVLREMAQHFGRAVSLIIIALMSVFVHIGWAFLLAAIASIALNFVHYVHHKTV